MNHKLTAPMEIERESFSIITQELKGRCLPAEQDLIVKRVIHTTADFDFADNLYFSPGAVAGGLKSLVAGATIVCDTNMVAAGINRPALTKLGGTVRCFMADEDVAEEAKRRGITRAWVSMERASKLTGPLIFAIGNAPTALMCIKQLLDDQAFRPDLIIAVPVGFVNVVESKELFLDGGVPAIVARGRKGGSPVAAAICNAMLYQVSTRQ